MIRLSFTPESKRDLRDISNFIAKDNPDAAITFAKRLRQRCVDLTKFPNVGRKHLGFRTLAEGDYVIVFRLLNNDKLVILRIVHGKRDLGRFLGELS